MVSTLKKSLSTMLEAWARRNVFQLSLERDGAGPRPCRRRRLRIAIAETRQPCLISSPRIRNASPAGVLFRHPQDQLSKLSGESWPVHTAPLGERRPLLAHQLAVPTQNGLRFEPGRLTPDAVPGG